MKAALSILAVLAILMFSCSKSADVANPYFTGIISATVDGQTVTYNSGATAVVINQSGNYSFNLGGYSGSAGSSDRLNISIASKTKAIGVAVYNDSIPNNDYTLSFGFQEQPANVSYGAGSSPYYVTVAITSLTSSEIKGTFSGTVGILSGSGSTTMHTFADGKFYLPLNR